MSALAATKTAAQDFVPKLRVPACARGFRWGAVATQPQRVHAVFTRPRGYWGLEPFGGVAIPRRQA